MTDEPGRSSGLRLADERHQRIGGHVERQREPVARRVDERRPRGPRAGRRPARGPGCRANAWVAAQRSKTARICSSDWTSHGSTKVDPIDSASGRTRRSMRLSTDEKPTSAPSSWSARAMPQAIEWSLATPKISAFLPSSSPIRLLQRSRSGRPRPAYPGDPATLRMMRTVDPPPSATRCVASAALLLDLDGVIVSAGQGGPGLGRRRQRARAAAGRPTGS